MPHNSDIRSKYFRVSSFLRAVTRPENSGVKKKLECTEDKYYELHEGLIYKELGNGKLLFLVPECMKTNVIRAFHDDLGHFGVDKVVENISRTYWFPAMRKKVKNHISNCLKCIDFSHPSGKFEGYLHSLDKFLPFQTIHIDDYGPLERYGRGYKHILSIVDFTKYIKLYPCKSTKYEEAIRHLKEYFRYYSKPKRLISDRGTCFTSALIYRFHAG